MNNSFGYVQGDPPHLWLHTEASLITPYPPHPAHFFTPTTKVRQLFRVVLSEGTGMGFLRGQARAGSGFRPLHERSWDAVP